MFSRIQFFLIISTCFLYLVAAGLFSKAVWNFEANKVSLVESCTGARLTFDSGIKRLEEMLTRLDRGPALMIFDRAFGMSM
jgi:hypothetical protein